MSLIGQALLCSWKATSKNTSLVRYDICCTIAKPNNLGECVPPNSLVSQMDSPALNLMLLVELFCRIDWDAQKKVTVFVLAVYIWLSLHIMTG